MNDEKGKGQQARKEEFSVSGEQLLAKVKELIKAGNIRRIAIKGSDGRVIIEFPLTLGVVGALLLPVLTAVGAIAALAMEYTIVIDRGE
jgi:hypothetical protein